MDTDLQQLRIDKSLKASRIGRRRWIPIAAILALLLLAFALYRARTGSGGTVVETLTIQLPDNALLENDVPVLNATGYIIAAHKIELACKVVGRVAWVGVERGDKVQQGETLVRLENDEYLARVVSQEGMLEAAQAKLAELEAGSRVEEVAQVKAQWDQAVVELENAKLNVQRFRDLITTRSVSRQELDDAESLVRAREARVDSARQTYELAKAGPRKEQIAAQRTAVKQMQGGLALAKVDFDNTVIKSPLAGTILERNVEVGEFVTTGFVGDRGAKGYVVSLADLDDLRVELDVSQNDFAKTALGQPCWITTDAYPDRKYEGVVDLISPEANRQKATVQVRVKVLAPDGLLRPDMNATVSFLSPEKLAAYNAFQTIPAAQRPVIRIPQSALKDKLVFVIEEGKAQPREVTPGETVNGQVEIKRGLRRGDPVILTPDRVKAGDPVTTHGSTTQP